MKQPLQSPSRLLKASAAAARWSLWLLLAAWLAFTVAWGALHGWIVPRIGEFRPRLEVEVSRALGVPVRIGGITAQSMGLIPSFELSNVVLLDREGREALRLGRVLAAVSPASLLKLGFEQIYIDAPELDIRRAMDGKIRVAGLEFSSGSRDDGQAADWLFSQAELVIRGGTVRWTDELRDAPPLALSQVDFVLRNRARRHDLRLDATPPAGWGERFSLMAMFRQPLLSVHNGRWQDWDGQLYADFSKVDVSQLRRHADLGVDLAQGHGALRLWADMVRGDIVGATGDAALAGVSATLGAGLQPLALNSVAGRLAGRRLAGGFEFSTRDLQFVTAQGQQWPGGNVMLSYTQGEGRVPARGEFRADKLDLAALSLIANRLPLGAATHEALAAYAPNGLVEVVQASWQGRPEAPQKFQVKGRVARLEIAAHTAAGGVPGGKPAAGSPGVRGASIDFDLNQAGGKATVAIQNGALEFPGTFEEPVVPVDQLSTQVQWQVDGERLGVQLTGLKFSNSDAEGQAQVSWHTSDPAQSRARSRFPGVLDLSGTLSRANGTRVHRYLPLVLSDPVRHYVRDGVTAGTASGVKFRVKGDLHDMPFTNPKHGEFHIAAQVKNATYAFVPRSTQPSDALPWPALTQLSAELVFDRASMQIKGATGKLTGAPTMQVTKADAQIADLAHTEVVVTADARGPLGEMLAIVNTSPLAGMTGQALAQASATGTADLKLRLALPISTIDKSKVQGSVTLAGNDVQITPQSPMLGKARGVVGFTETGFSVTGGQARMLGGDVRLEGGSRAIAAVGPAPAEAAIVLRAQGTFTAEGLRQASELGFLSRLAHNATGGAAYSAVLSFRRGQPELSVSSSLQGLALNLPSPLNKTTESTLPLRFENTQVMLPKGQSGLQDQLSIDLGRVASVTYVRDIAGPQARVLRGGIAIGLLPGESAPVPDEGVIANVNLANVNIDAWEAVMSKATGTPVAASASAARQSPAAAASTPALSYLPTVIAVRAKELTMEGRRLHNVVVGGSREGLTWRANVEATELNGYVEYRQSPGSGAGRVYARLARLTIAQSAANDVEALLNEQTDSVPALDIVVDDFELRGRKLGRVEVEAINRGSGAVAREGGVREWRLTKLHVLLPEATFSASGNWAGINAQAALPGGPRPASNPGEQRRTVMNFKLDIADSGALLARFGMKDVVRLGKGHMEGQVSWIGSPLALDYPTLGGQFNVNIETGQFLKADPGLAKLLGVLSLQSLPRRLTLDFRDVFTEGFSFDFVRGDVRIEQGIAITNNLQMKGVNAAVLMDGRADIAKETQNLKVVVVPEINAGTASLVATVINPAIGLGTFLAQMFLRRPLMEAATQEFQIDGTWSDPKIVKVDRRSAIPETRTGSVP